METMFRVLTYANKYIDANRLHEGLYVCAIPFVYDKENTIEKMLKQAEDVRDKMGVWHITDRYFECLKQCELVNVTINPS